MELDTEFALSTMSYDKSVESFPRAILHENDVRLRTATGESFEPIAYTSVQVSYKDQKRLLRLYLMKSPQFPTLFGRMWMRALLITFPAIEPCNHNITSNYKEAGSRILQKFPNLCKDGIRKIPPMEMKLHFKVRNQLPFMTDFVSLLKLFCR